ncbi:hypothetical protein GCM10027614_34780 [Micromonospora vulcania]
MDAGRLLRGSRARGRRRQLHRRVAAGTALALVGVLGFVAVPGTGIDGLTSRLPWSAGAPSEATPVPPRADGVPGAAAEPTLVGSDPQVLHFGLDPAKARYLGWAAFRANVESVRLSVGDGQPVYVEAATSVELLSSSVSFGSVELAVGKPRTEIFDGTSQPATGPASGLVKSWQPAPGLYARAVILQGGRAELERAVDALRWNEARWCAVPLRLGAVPEGATIASCSVDVSSYPRLVTSDLNIRRAASEYMFVSYRFAIGAGTRTAGNRTIAGRPALFSGTGKLELLGIPRTEVLANYDWLGPGDTHPFEVTGSDATTRFTEADATTVLAGARIIEDPTRPQNWK